MFSEQSHSTMEITKNKAIKFSLNQVAGTYDIFEAIGGDVLIEMKAAYVTKTGLGFTSLSLATDDTPAKSIVGSTPVVSVVKNAAAVIAAPIFVLEQGRKIRLTLVGNGTAGEICIVVGYSPVTLGGAV